MWSQIFVALNGRKRGRKTPGTDLRSPKRKKKGKGGGSRSCFRQSQLIDRRIEWLFLLHFTPPLSASVTPDRGAYLSIFLIVLFSPLPLSFPSLPSLPPSLPPSRLSPPPKKISDKTREIKAPRNQKKTRWRPARVRFPTSLTCHLRLESRVFARRAGGVGGEVEGSTPGEGGWDKFSGAFCASWWMILAVKLPVNDR